MKRDIALTSPLRVMIPIIKIVGDFCNLKCGYCFYNGKNQQSKTIMHPELLEKFIRQYLELFNGDVTFIWHGGEPLMAGIDLFRRLVATQNEYSPGREVKNCIQTNTTLVNAKWAQFFEQNHFGVGVSVDGCKACHDRFRLSGRGIGTFDRVMSGISALRAHGIRPGVIQTLTASNLPLTGANFDFFYNTMGVRSWSTNVYKDISGSNRHMAGEGLSNEELSAFFREQFELWLSTNDPLLRIREVENFLSPAFSKKAPSCQFNGSCTGYFCLNYDGKVYPCDRLSGDPRFLLGDLSRQSLADILNGEARIAYAKEVNKVNPECVKCRWLPFCNNGCTGHRVGGPAGKYFFCESRRDSFLYAEKRVQDFSICERR